MKHARFFRLFVTLVVLAIILGILFFVFEKSQNENNNPLTQPEPQETFFNEIGHMFKSNFGNDK